MSRQSEVQKIHPEIIQHDVDDQKQDNGDGFDFPGESSFDPSNFNKKKKIFNLAKASDQVTKHDIQISDAAELVQKESKYIQDEDELAQAN